jgi:hypothetical protein
LFLELPRVQIILLLLWMLDLWSSPQVKGHCRLQAGLQKTASPSAYTPCLPVILLQPGFPRRLIQVGSQGLWVAEEGC